MRIVLAAAGSRGDVLPFAALARGLAERGHEVTLLTHNVLLPTLDLPAGVSGVGAPSDPGTLLAGPAAQALRRGSPRALNRTRHLFADFVHAFAAPARIAVTGADVVIASSFAVAAVDAALTAGVPVIRAHQWPEQPGLDGPMPLLPYAWRLPAPARRLARGALRVVEPYLGGLDGWWERGRLQLHARHPVGLTTTTLGTLHAVSPSVVPDRAPGICVTGWWVGPDGGLSEAAAGLLMQPGPWVFVGFGSMQQSDPEQLLDQIARACAALGVRAVVQLGAAGDPRRGPATDATAVPIGPEPHSALFPLMSAVVHHGGSGTTGAAVRAGTPSVVVPHFADQYYWGHRLAALGVAPPAIPRRRLTAAALTRRLEEALRPGMQRRAVDLGARVRAEDGVATAVRYIERRVADS